MLRSDFLFALDEDGHPHRRLPVPGLNRRRVNRDPGLVVGRAAAEEPPARSVGSNGGDSQSSRGPGGCTS